MTNKTQNYNKGKKGEKEAREFLELKGFELVEANYEVDSGEIDLIMTDKNWLVFVEVKYKSSDRLGLPEEMIGRTKLNQVRRVAEIYLLKNPHIRQQFSRYRIDAVCILGNQIKHYPNLD